MAAARMAVCALVAAAAMAQSDISERLRRALPSPEGEAASQALAKKDFGQVEELLARSKGASDADRAELLAISGAVEFLDGKMGQAASAFRESARLAPLNDGDSFTLAMAFVTLEEDAQARPVLAGLAEKHPDRAIYLYWLGRLDYDQRRYQEAVEKLTKATELDPRSARAWDSLGLAFDMQGRMEQARGALQKAADFNREQAVASPWPPHDLGYLLLRMDRFTEAEAALRESLRYYPNLAQTHYYLGRALEKEGQAEKAMDEYVRAVSLDRASPDACYSLAMLYRKLHRDNDAAAMFSEFKKRRQASQAAVGKPGEESSR